MNALQLRLNQPETTVAMASEGLTDNERLCARIRELEAAKKTIETELKLLKDEARELARDGEMVGGANVGGYYKFSESKRTTFDANKAMEAGLINQRGEWAEFWSVTVTERFIFSPINEVAK